VSQAASGGAASSDAEILDRVRSGDERALGELVRRHQDAAYRVALSLLGSDADAADAAQEGMLKAVRGLDRFRGDASFKTWLLSIVANEARTLQRRSTRRREAPLEDDLPGAAGVADEVAMKAEADRARGLLAGLPEKQRLAVQLRVDEGLSFREVGEVIGSTEGAARVNYHHGIRRLRELMNR
jgi:RNA polymerase sigma-70 factor (ECF subfamily)